MREFLIFCEVQTGLISVSKVGVGGDYITFEWDLLTNQTTVFDTPPSFCLDPFL
jgi:hypothetical protein